MAHGSEATGGVALTGVGPVRQQQHPDCLQVDVVHLFVSGHLDAAGQGSRGAEHTGGWEGRRGMAAGTICMLCTV